MGADRASLEPLERIGILGAGTMGAGIAQVAVEAGVEAVVHDPIVGAYERAHGRIAGFLTRRVEKGQLDAAEAAAALDRLVPAASLEELTAVDLVVEAIPEELELKRDAFRRLDQAIGRPQRVVEVGAVPFQLGGQRTVQHHEALLRDQLREWIHLRLNR